MIRVHGGRQRQRRKKKEEERIAAAKREVGLGDSFGRVMEDRGREGRGGIVGAQVYT